MSLILIPECVGQQVSGVFMLAPAVQFLHLEV